MVSYLQIIRKNSLLVNAFRGRLVFKNTSQDTRMILMPTPEEIKLIVYVFAWVFLNILLFELLMQKGIISSYVARKLIHMSIFLPIFLAYTMVERPLFPLLLTGCALVFTYVTSPVFPYEKTRLRVFHEGHPWGTTLFSLSVFVIILLLFDRPEIGLVSGSALALGDGMSGLIGKKYGNIRPSLFRGKSIEGSIAFFLAGTAGGILSMEWLGLLESFEMVVLVGVAVAIGAIFEVLSEGGIDNITVPTSVGLSMFFFMYAASGSFLCIF